MEKKESEVLKFVAKFRVGSVTVDPEYPGQENVTSYAQYGNGPEDNEFAKSTPSGSYNFIVTNPAIVGTITPGDIFMINTTVIREVWS